MPVLHPAVIDSSPLMWLLIVLGWVVLAVTAYGVFRNRPRG